MQLFIANILKLKEYLQIKDNYRAANQLWDVVTYNLHKLKIKFAHKPNYLNKTPMKGTSKKSHCFTGFSSENNLITVNKPGA